MTRHLTVAVARVLAAFAAAGGLYWWALLHPDLSWWVATPLSAAATLLMLSSISSLRRAGERDRAEIRAAGERERAEIRRLHQGEQ